VQRKYRGTAEVQGAAKEEETAQVELEGGGDNGSGELFEQ